MCGRYGLWSPLQTLRQRYGIQDTGQPGLPLAPVAPRYNIAPTQAAIVVHESPTLGRRELTTMQWGLTPAWAAQSGKHSPTPINAKRESLGGRFWHRYVAGGGRCIVPADGWYEWRLEQGAKQPYLLHGEDGDLLSFAGLYDEATRSYAIVVGPAPERLRAIHDRAPIVLGRDDIDAWLAPQPLPEERMAQMFDASQAGTYRYRPVDKAISSPRNDGPELLTVE